MPFATFGSATNVPAPRRRVSWPSRTSSSSAARTVSRETPSSTPSRRSDGIAVADLERLDQLEHAARASRAASSPRRRELGRAARAEAQRPSRGRRSGSAAGRRRARARSPTRAPCVASTRAVKSAPAGAAGCPRPSASSTSAVIGGASTVEEDVRVGAELLQHLDCDLDRREARVRRRRPRSSRAGSRGRRGRRPAGRGRPASGSAELAEPDDVAVDRRLDEVHRRRADEAGDEEVRAARS